MTADLDQGASALRTVFETYAQIAKSVIDSDPRDSATFTRINGYLDEVLSHWNPKHATPERWELEHLEGQPDVDQRRLSELQRQVAENEERARVKEDLVTWRSVQRFGLLWWIQRQLRETGDDAYADAWRSFIGYFGNLSEAARVTDRAVQADFEDRGRWMHWIPTPAHGASYSPAIDLEFVQTFVLIALTYASPDTPSPQFEPLEWLSGQLTDIQATVQAVVGNERLRPLLPDDRLEERGATVVAAFESMIRTREEREEQRVIESSLDTEAVAGFKQRLRDEWSNNRMLAGGFQRAGTYQVVESAPAADVPRWQLRQRWMLKNWLIADPRVGGIESYARELGRALGESEAKVVVDAAGGAPTFLGTPDESIAQLLRGAVAELAGYGELVILAPHHWRWPTILELTVSEQRGGPAATPPWLPPDIRSRFVGTAEGVPVVESRETPEGRLLVFSLAAFARWRQWRPPGHHEVTVEITSFDEELALQFVTEHPDQFRSEERTTAEARARELRKHVLLDVHERVRLEIADPVAARWVDVPPAALDPMPDTAAV